MFRKNRCYLCGDKLRNGYCDSCGLDNNRIHRIRYHLNQSAAAERLDMEDEKKLLRRIKNKEQKHEKLHRDLAEERRQAKAAHRAGQQVGNAYQIRTEGLKNKAKPRKNRAGKLLFDRKKIGGIVAAVIVLVGIGGEILENVHISQPKFGGGAEKIAVETQNPYEYVTKELAAEGDAFEADFYPGEYQVGVHIPEGKYEIQLMEGYGSFHVEDDENGIYLWQTFGEDEEYDEVRTMEDVRLYQGAILRIRDSVCLRFTSSNAQKDKLQAAENPLLNGEAAAGVTIVQDKHYEAGKDFPAGVYDVTSSGKWAIFNYSVPTENTDEEYDAYEYFAVVEEEGIGRTFHNVVLTEGTEVSAEEGDVTLAPSQAVNSGGYQSYYEN